MTELYLGVDPGRSKTGLAVTDRQGKILYLLVAETAQLRRQLLEVYSKYTPGEIIIGNGTNSKHVAGNISEWLPEVPLQIVEEAHSTEEARTLYWQENPPTGIKKLIPRGMLVPSEPLDAYAAVVLIKRYLKL